MHTWYLYDLINQCHPNNFNLKKWWKRRKSKERNRITRQMILTPWPFEEDNAQWAFKLRFFLHLPWLPSASCPFPPPSECLPIISRSFSPSHLKRMNSFQQAYSTFLFNHVSIYTQIMPLKLQTWNLRPLVARTTLVIGWLPRFIPSFRRTTSLMTHLGLHTSESQETLYLKHG